MYSGVKAAQLLVALEMQLLLTSGRTGCSLKVDISEWRKMKPEVTSHRGVNMNIVCYLNSKRNGDADKQTFILAFDRLGTKLIARLNKLHIKGQLTPILN